MKIIVLCLINRFSIYFNNECVISTRKSSPRFSYVFGFKRYIYLFHAYVCKNSYARSKYGDYIDTYNTDNITHFITRPIELIGLNVL